MRAAGRRRAAEQIASDRKPPPPTPTTDPWHFTTRDSDASFASSRPSSSSIGPRSSTTLPPINDRPWQISAVRFINSYLSSHSLPTSLKIPVPSAKEISDTLKFLFSRLDFNASNNNNNNKLEDDLTLLLKLLNCPFKFNKSALRAPSPHNSPTTIAVIHWLVQIALFNDHLSNSAHNHSAFEDNSMLNYTFNSYLYYIRGDDDLVDVLDRESLEKLQQQRDVMEEEVRGLEGNVSDLEGKLESLRSGPSERELLEKDKSVLEEDVRKFHAMIEQLDGHIGTVEKVLEEKEKELKVKIGERERILEENEELKRRVEEQAINARDAERIKRELQAVERDIGEAEVGRNSWEEKAWDLDAGIGHKFKELEGLLIECNQALRRLKLGNDFRYELNAKGSTPAEVLGIDYKSTLKPTLTAFADDIKKSSMANLEELISLQQQSVENALKIEAKRNRIVVLQSHIEEVEVQLNILKKERQDCASSCATEARKMAEDVEAQTRNLDITEREAAEFLQTSKVKLQEAITQTEEEVQLCACELIALVDSVSKYKEHTESKISEMKNALSETAVAISDVHKASLAAQFGIDFDANH